MDKINLITLGRIVRAHGVHGAVKALYFGHDPNIALNAPKLYLVPVRPGKKTLVSSDHRVKIVPGGIILKLNGCSTRDQASTLRGYELAVNRSDLPNTEQDEYYQADLLNLEAITTSGRILGKVEKVMETGSVLVLVITSDDGRETLVPFSEDCVPEVRLSDGRLIVSELPGLLD
ncbi:MAG: ribosome maturation factor RimM [Deltaproteobacteria bacterium]|jgi:16S rRNA processing protein RimM|nr:ribosome maturation factor RimM [Deltaproteobacteria bacterium]